MDESLKLDDIVETAKRQFTEAMTTWGDNNIAMLDDLQFLAGGEGQWDQDILANRTGRPCLTINKLPAFIDQVTGDQLQNKPQVKFIPVDDEADPDTAEVMTGLLRHIEQQSDAEIAYDTAFESATGCGKGAWRILTDYCDGESFDQEIKIERILNRFSVIPDPAAQKWDYSDGQFFFITDDLERDSFIKLYPNASIAEWESSDDTTEWITATTVRIAEYFYKKPVAGTLYELEYQDGTKAVVKDLPEKDDFNPYIVNNKRKINTDGIWWCKLNGKEILEGPAKLPGSYFPIVLVWGKELVLDKKRVYRGVIRHAKDPQRGYNYARSAQVERNSLAKPSPYFITPKQIENHEGMWNNAPNENRYYMLYNPDTAAAGAPQRQMPGQIDTSLQAEMMVCDQEIHDTTGLQLASLGKKSNEKSGIAISARQREGDIGNHAYTNNLARAQKYSAKVILDLVPKIYDTARIIRILGPDGAQKMVHINEQYQDEGGEWKAHDLGIGKYDVVVSIGPSYTTLRQESAQSMVDIMKTMPPQMIPGVIDLVVGSLDWPNSDKFEDRLKKMVPAELKDEPVGPDGQPQGQALAQVDPMQQQIQQMQMQMAQLQFETAQVTAELEKAKLDGVTLDNEMKKLQMAKAHQEIVHKEVGLEKDIQGYQQEAPPDEVRESVNWQIR
jgi:hypothetical protein